MDGLLVVDKPAGPTSHDVVARMRRTLGEPRVGHTGTLDPAASGVLPLVIGRATRLARFLSGAEKSYRATVRLGVQTDSYDMTGARVALAYAGPLPNRQTIDRALDDFRGAFPQQPPAYSAKKIGGERSHRLARRAAALASVSPLPPVASVIVRRLEILDLDGDCLTLQVDCSAGFYVRTLAHEVGVRLGTGAHLAGLCRLRSGDLTLAGAIPLNAIEHDPDAARAAIVPLALMLPSVTAWQLTEEGARRACHGRDLGPDDFAGHQAIPAIPVGPGPDGSAQRVRLLSPGGELVGLAEPATTPGFLHPFVVLV